MAAVVNSCVVQPYKQALADSFTFQSKYDGTVECFLKMGDYICLPRGAALWDVDNRDEGIAINFNTGLFKPQKPEQLEVIKKSTDLLMQDKQFIVAAPTGWGKTYVGTQIAGVMGRRFCVITTKEDVVGQWVKAIQETLGLDISEIGVWRGDQVPLPTHKAVVALVQSVAKGSKRYGEEAYRGFGLVLCDEVHRMGAEQFSQAMWHFPSQYRIGMSATPQRKDGRDRVFQWHIGPVMVEAKMEVLVPKILRHKTGWKVPRSSAGMIPHEHGNISLLMKPMCRNPQRNALIVQYLKSTYEKGRSTIAFTDNLEHILIVADLLSVAGVPSTDVGFYVGLPSDVYGSTKGEKGRKAKDMAARREHSTRPIVLSTYAMASEATNLPWLDTCIMMTPKAEVEQIIGRIRREYDDKKDPVVIDLVDDDSPVLRDYATKRYNWYIKLGCVIRPYS